MKIVLGQHVSGSVKLYEIMILTDFLPVCVRCGSESTSARWTSGAINVRPNLRPPGNTPPTAPLFLHLLLRYTPLTQAWPTFALLQGIAQGRRWIAARAVKSNSLVPPSGVAFVSFVRNYKTLPTVQTSLRYAHTSLHSRFSKH